MSASLALAPPAPTPARGTLQLRADSRAPARWLQTRGHARRWRAEPPLGGDARGRRQLAIARPSKLEPRFEEPGAPAQQSPAAAAASLFYPSALRGASGTGPQKSRKSCLPPGERSPASLCLESQHLRLQCVPGELALGRTAGERGPARFTSGFRGGSSGLLLCICFNFWKSLFFFFFLSLPATGHVLI